MVISVSSICHLFGPAFNILTNIRWVAIKCGTDIHVPELIALVKFSLLLS